MGEPKNSLPPIFANLFTKCSELYKFGHSDAFVIILVGIFKDWNEIRTASDNLIKNKDKSKCTNLKICTRIG